MSRATQPIPTCPLCGTRVYKTHVCKVSALRPRPAVELHRDPPPAPPRSACLHAVTCLDVRAGRPCPLVADKPANFDALVAAARDQARLTEATLYDLTLREDIGL